MAVGWPWAYKKDGFVMNDIGDSDFYLGRIDRYWRRLGRLFRSSDRILPKYLDISSAARVGDESYREFRHVLSDLPYIGGDGNMLTPAFVSSAAGLAYIRVLERHGLSEDIVGQVLNEVYDDVFTSLPNVVKWWLRRSKFSPGYRKKLRACARRSKLQEYPGDWVMEYIEGDGDTFGFGCNFTECAVLKLFRQKGAEKYMPYVCVTDFTTSRALRTGLQRTTTLYFGGDCCDFRYEKNRLGALALPIEDLPEYRNRSN